MTTSRTPDVAAPGAPARGLFALLGDRRFGPYVTGQFLSSTGNWFHNVAIGIVAFEVTGSSTVVGVLTGLQYVFMLLLSPLAGVLSDRLDRRKLLAGAQSLAMTGAVGLAILVGLLGVEDAWIIWPIAGFTVLIGVGYSLGLPTLQAYVPMLVPRRDLPGAIALNSVSFNLARAIGPGLAGALVAAAGAAIAFGVNALSFVVFIGVLLWLGRPAQTPAPGLALPPERVGSGTEEDQEATSPDRSVWAGLRLARSDRTVGTVMLATIGLGMATDPVLTLAPALAARLGEGARLVGLIGSAFGLGGVLSSFTVQRVRSAVGPRRQAAGGLATISLGLAVGGTATQVGVLLAGMGIAGAGFLQSATTLNSTLQMEVDDAIRGRVMALWGMAFLGVRPLAAFIDGGIADLTSPTVATLLAAAIALAAAIGLLVSTPRPHPADAPRDLDEPHIAT